jgi:hypothetical protein
MLSGRSRAIPTRTLSRRGPFASGAVGQELAIAFVLVADWSVVPAHVVVADRSAVT